MVESDALSDLARWLLDHVQAQEDGLFPALIDSMAGSDAVCLRELTVASTGQHRALESALRRAAGGDLPVEQVLALCRQHVAGEEAELLPMAARLLGDDEVARWRSREP